MREDFFDELVSVFNGVNNPVLKVFIGEYSDGLVNELFLNYNSRGEHGASNYVRLVKARLSHLNHFNKKVFERVDKDLIISRELGKVSKFNNTNVLEGFVKKFLEHEQY